LQVIEDQKAGHCEISVQALIKAPSLSTGCHPYQTTCLFSSRVCLYHVTLPVPFRSMLLKRKLLLAELCATFVN